MVACQAMAKELNVKTAGQATKNSCWACCARLVANYYVGHDVYATDVSFATTVKRDASVVQDIQPVLKAAGILFGQDDANPFPTAAEVIKEIDAGRPLIACITTNLASVQARNVAAGHYVIITGYEGNAQKCLIQVMDPAQNKKDWVPYSGTNFISPNYLGTLVYWGVTYYTKGG